MSRENENTPELPEAKSEERSEYYDPLSGVVLHESAFSKKNNIPKQIIIRDAATIVGIGISSAISNIRNLMVGGSVKKGVVANLVRDFDYFGGVSWLTREKPEEVTDDLNMNAKKSGLGRWKDFARAAAVGGVVGYATAPAELIAHYQSIGEKIPLNVTKKNFLTSSKEEIMQDIKTLFKHGKARSRYIAASMLCLEVGGQVADMFSQKGAVKTTMEIATESMGTYPLYQTYRDGMKGKSVISSLQGVTPGKIASYVIPNALAFMPAMYAPHLANKLIESQSKKTNDKEIGSSRAGRSGR